MGTKVVNLLETICCSQRLLPRSVSPTSASKCGWSKMDAKVVAISGRRNVALQGVLLASACPVTTSRSGLSKQNGRSGYDDYHETKKCFSPRECQKWKCLVLEAGARCIYRKTIGDCTMGWEETEALGTDDSLVCALVPHQWIL